MLLADLFLGNALKIDPPRRAKSNIQHFDLTPKLDNAITILRRMSAEVVAKKRGRPKKVIVDPIEVESIKTTTTRAKSTKATVKAVAVKPVAAKSTTATKTVTASKAASASVRKASPKAIAPKSSPAKAPLPSSQSPPSTTTKPIAKAEDREAIVQGSQILSKVQEKQGSPSAKFTATQSSSQLATPSSQISHMPAPLSTTPVAAPIEAAKQPNQDPPHAAPPKVVKPYSAASSTSKPVPMAKAPPPPPKAAPAPKLPIAALNSAIVNNISTRAGAKPNMGSSKSLPANYKSNARKVTMFIVALPLLVFSSYGLYQRCKYLFVTQDVHS